MTSSLANLESIAAQLRAYNKAKQPVAIYTDLADGAKWGTIDGRIENQEDLIALLDALKKELEDEIEAGKAAIFVYKGTVETVESLPETAVVGDTYNVEETGANYCWNGTEWDKLSETIDVSKFAVKEVVDAQISALTEVVTGLNNKLSVVAEETNTSAGDITLLINRVNVLEDKVDDLKKTNKEVVVLDGQTSLDDVEKDFILSGDVATTLTVTGKSVDLDNVAVTDSARVNLNTEGDVKLSDVTFDGVYAKSGGNSISNIHSDGYVLIKDCTVNAQNGYNALEIGLGTGLAKNVVIDNVDFTGKFANNAISIFGTADNAVITISNCHFQEVSNAIRLSNRSNVNCTINVVNCTVDKWQTGEYAGLIICQDYTSGSAEAENTNNLFGAGKVTINIQNLTKPDGTKLTAPENIADICGSGNDQILYVYYDRQGTQAFNADKYPVLNIR